MCVYTYIYIYIYKYIHTCITGAAAILVVAAIDASDMQKMTEIASANYYSIQCYSNYTCNRVIHVIQYSKFGGRTSDVRYDVAHMRLAQDAECDLRVRRVQDGLLTAQLHKP